MAGHHGQLRYLAQHLTDHVNVWKGATRLLLSGTTSLYSRPQPSYRTSTCALYNRNVGQQMMSITAKP